MKMAALDVRPRHQDLPGSSPSMSLQDIRPCWRPGRPASPPVPPICPGHRAPSVSWPDAACAIETTALRMPYTEGRVLECHHFCILIFHFYLLMALASPTHALGWISHYVSHYPRYVQLASSSVHSGGTGINGIDAHYYTHILKTQIAGSVRACHIKGAVMPVCLPVPSGRMALAPDTGYPVRDTLNPDSKWAIP